MGFRAFGFLLIALVGLTACGGEPEGVNMDRRYLMGEDLNEQLASLRAAINGDVLEAHQWVQGDKDVYTLLSREVDAKTQFSGLYLRHYRVGEQSPELLWTYQDSVSCGTSAGAAGGATAGAGVVISHSSPELRPASITDINAQQFLLRYEISCQGESEKSMVVIDAASGTPDVRLSGDAEGLNDAFALVGLPEDTIQRLLAYWE
ncbi:hypothetical protein [Neolewinella agarilytica]|uniref:hypothetical protein n=1 Tax=Neolewinella agarilytica TaxID=478744 RepID=UPI002352472D|nr:hypothetical protein [Neolewinella agarilytica]